MSRPKYRPYTIIHPESETRQAIDKLCGNVSLDVFTQAENMAEAQRDAFRRAEAAYRRKHPEYYEESV